ncbi:LytTR family DNA-binding domain-containing protein [Terrimonas sp. NA20]|uniref:LytTR family DNA-binding domain-containing protein n=1 Tax=Terrimonas ginsenosidimutans TaxID=2908004 RepID=A0ABS9KP41_9BACT|nr:LytTR family DNA-binding domain-containing protein [Terrimonas ginsenosidimutans]MCG2614104.1 LytTR family DNA-binding domain-containing protein [Terrimonas ginsenosidimutans]
MIRCLLVDDEPWALELLTSYISRLPSLELVAATTKPLEALMLANPEKTDLIFLDIQMPELNGIKFMQAVNQQCKVIITSAYAEYAVEGFEHNVTDYLLKPISFERFCKAVQKAAGQLSLPETTNTASHIFVKTDNKLVKVDFDEILYLEGARDYVFIHTRKDKLITLDSLKNLEDVLPSSLFARIHKSFIVAVDKIDAIEKSRVVIGEHFLPIGEIHKSEFLASINKSRNS